MHRLTAPGGNGHGGEANSHAEGGGGERAGRSRGRCVGRWIEGTVERGAEDRSRSGREGHALDSHHAVVRTVTAAAGRQARLSAGRGESRHGAQPKRQDEKNADKPPHFTLAKVVAPGGERAAAAAASAAGRRREVLFCIQSTIRTSRAGEGNGEQPTANSKHEGPAGSPILRAKRSARGLLRHRAGRDLLRFRRRPRAQRA